MLELPVRPDDHLHLHRALLGQDQRRLEGQLLDPVTADLVTGPDRQLDERRAGQQHRAPHRVVGEPRVRRSDSRPVSTTPSPPASSTAAPSSGCSAAVPGPPRPRRRSRRPGSSQYRSRWNA